MKIEKEPLIKILDCCIEDDCCHCPNAYKDGNIVACEDFARKSVNIPYSIMRETINALKEQKEERKEEQSDWISVKERMPVELHSIFWSWYGKKEWRNAMWREQSDKVLVTVEFKDGTRLVTTGETHDGVWNTAISRTLDPIVTHWMQFPELPEKR